MNIKINDVVKFNEKAVPAAARWCCKHNITGLVVEEFMISNKKSDLWKVETALDYPIWAPGGHLSVVTNLDDSPMQDDIGC